ncbi:hypothetical protein EHM76_07370 [bacterium]|nr:MAG: hypothetical protein EHM76_07370 [bacterium]
MGQIIDKENIFRNALIKGLIDSGVKFSNRREYPDVNYGLIIKPLNMDYNFREPIRMFFKGYPFHIGVIRNDKIYSFCPDLLEPHRGTIYKDIIIESLNEWENGEIFWFLRQGIEYPKIEARLIDLIQVVHKLLDLAEFNRRHHTSLKAEYNLLSNNCTDVAMTVLIGETRCFQIEAVADTIVKLSNIDEIRAMIPEYAKIWLQDFKYLK